MRAASSPLSASSPSPLARPRAARGPDPPGGDGLHDATGTNVTLVDQVSGAVKTAHLADVHPWRLVPVRDAKLASGAKDLLVTLQTNSLLQETMAAWAIDDLLALVTVPAIAEGTVKLSTLDGTRTLTALTGPVDSGDGRVIAVATALETGSAIGLAGIAFSMGAQSFFVTPPAGRTLDAKLSDRYFEGLASGVRDTGYPPTFAFALDGGRVGLLDGGAGLNQATADANIRVVGTWSASPLGGISFG